jgi:hypothetical protein
MGRGIFYGYPSFFLFLPGIRVFMQGNQIIFLRFRHG